MFKLHRLEITGFKSFADYTEIVFTGNGITAVVGPNGCGKSNVSDCIAWVLGEQRAKSLRGGEMKDVIFQGSKNRKPSGMAEVVLHLVRDEDFFDVDESELEDIDEALSAIDDQAVDVEALEIQDAEIADPLSAVHIEENGFHADEFEVEKVQAAQVGSIQTVERTIKTKRHWRPRSFALDFAPGEAVSVTRRLYLSGESEYQLNGKACRLRDIQDLFAGTGLSGAHYAIIEQGRIGQILSAKPADRRNLIEEAAGISKFRTRQRAAETRLESAKINLGRISDIVSEIDKQANSLRRQAGKTRRYIVLQEEFRVLLRQLFAAEGRHLSSLIDELETGLASAIKVEKDFAAKVAKQEEDLREATLSARSADESLAAVRGKHSQNALERDRADREHRYQSEQIVNFNNRLEILRTEIAADKHRVDLIRTEIARLEKDEKKEGSEAGAAEAVLHEAENRYAARIDEVRSIESDMEARRGELLNHTAAAERFEEIGRQLTSNLERLLDRAGGLEREAVRAEEAIAGHKADAKKVSADLVSEHKKLEGLNDEKKSIFVLAADARVKLRASEDNLKTLQNEFSRAKNRHETLLELEEKRAVYAPQVQKLFAEQKTAGVKPLGVLADFLNVDANAEKAVESLFGPFLQAVLVESVRDAKRIAAWQRSNDVGRIACLVVPKLDLTAVNARRNNGSGRIEYLLGVSDDFREILRKILPREMSAEFVETVDDSAWKSSDILVDKSGDILIGGSLFISGSHDTGTQNASLLAFKRELSGLGRTVEQLASGVEKAATTMEKDRQKLTDLEEKTVDLQSLIIKIERGVIGLEAQEKSAIQEIERSERHRKVVADETSQLTSEIAEVRGRIDEAAASAKSARNLCDESRGVIEKIAALLTTARESSDAENLVLNEKRTLAATSAERRRSIQSSIRRATAEQKELESRVAIQNLEITEIEGKITGLRDSISQIAESIASVADQHAEEAAELAGALENVKIERERSDSISAALAEINRGSVEAANHRAAIEVRQTEALTHLKNVGENCVHELNTPLADLVANEILTENFDLAESRSRVSDLRERLDGFGAINMLAVEELGEAEERLLFLTSQRQDIIDSIASAEEALREIKERSRQRFKQAFEAINANFVVFFQELFGGGRGEMTLLESDDILEAGIEVVAQPPGKRLQNILLLSGGEKAMTAIALVLAIFKYRPSPFCLLDEVDAPLDDANVARFVNKIAEMSEKTQFIVITHNKRTMEAARALYGVTMQEAGVSKIVSVKFE